MAKPDSALLDPARYPFHCAIAPRFGDLDTNLHLNNVALVAILDDGRVRFHYASGFLGAKSGPTVMVVSFSVEFLGQAFYPQALDVHVAVARIGRTSYVLQQLLRQDGRIIGSSQSVMVCVADNLPAAIPGPFIDAVGDWMLRP